MKKIIIYDFDGTLTPNSIPKLEILERCGIEEGIVDPKFRKMLSDRIENKDGDYYQSLYETFFETIKNAGFKLNNHNFTLGCNKVIYNKGVLEFLDMLKKNDVDNYLLSSGMKVFLNGISIAPYFNEIYATEFSYDGKEEVTGIKYLMSDKNKVSAIKDILAKNNLCDCSNIIYIGDGLTDYYAMEYVKNHGGESIVVYINKNYKSISNSKMRDVVTFFTKADYSKNGQLVKYIKDLCDIYY